MLLIRPFWTFKFFSVYFVTASSRFFTFHNVQHFFHGLSTSFLCLCKEAKITYWKLHSITLKWDLIHEWSLKNHTFSSMLIFINRILHIFIIVKNCILILNVFSFVQLLRITTYNRTILLSLHFCKFFDRFCYTSIIFVLATIKFTHINVICINTLMIITIWYSSRICFHNLFLLAWHSIWRMQYWKYKNFSVLQRLNKEFDLNAASFKISFAKYIRKSFCESFQLIRSF